MKIILNALKFVTITAVETAILFFTYLIIGNVFLYSMTTLIIMFIILGIILFILFKFIEINLISKHKKDSFQYILVPCTFIIIWEIAYSAMNLVNIDRYLILWSPVAIIIIILNLLYEFMIIKKIEDKKIKIGKKQMPIVIIIILLVIWFLYKFFNLYLYDARRLALSNYENLESFEIVKTKTIKHYQVDDYITFENIKIKNDFNDFEILEQSVNFNEQVIHVLRDENNKVVSSFWMGGPIETYISYFTTKNLLMFYDSDNELLYSRGEKRFLDADRKKILEKNNIKDDIELFQFLKDNKDNQNSIFTSIKKIKENYAIQFFISNMIVSNKITLINGDYNGYCLAYNPTTDYKVSECRLFKNEKLYYLIFAGFEESKIFDALSTVVIK